MTVENRTAREGLVVGLSGYAAVAGFYAAFDLLAARGPMFTVNLLGRAVFRGLRDPAVLQLPVAADAAAIAMYTALHLVVSLAIGFVVAWLVSQAEGPPSQARLALLSIVAGFFVTVFGIGMISAPIQALLPWSSVVLANLLAVSLAGAYLLRRHPGLLARFALRAA